MVNKLKKFFSKFLKKTKSENTENKDMTTSDLIDACIQLIKSNNRLKIWYKRQDCNGVFCVKKENGSDLFELENWMIDSWLLKYNGGIYFIIDNVYEQKNALELILLLHEKATEEKKAIKEKEMTQKLSAQQSKQQNLNYVVKQFRELAK